MAMFVPRKIILDSNPLIRKHSQDVPTPLSNEDSDTLKYMLEHLEVSQDEKLNAELKLRAGVGLAAPQLGILKKMIAIRIVYEKEDKTSSVVSLALVNPKIIAHSVKKSYFESGEGCLSVEVDHQGYVYRHANITVKAYDFFTNKEMIFKFRGYEAIVVQHEIDHLFGILYYDHIDKNEPFMKNEDAIAV
jgi:peptide deformylase